jgi:hypothetical protein
MLFDVSYYKKKFSINTVKKKVKNYAFIFIKLKSLLCDELTE